MNTRAMIAAAAIVAISLTAVATTRTAGSNAEKKTQPVRTVSIEELAAKPFSHLGRVRVEGVVTSADSGKGLLVVVSPKEFKECGTTCTDESKARVPVRWSLKPGETVIVEGTVKKDGKGVAFVADEVKKR